MHPAATFLHDHLFLIPLVVLILSEVAKMIAEFFKTGNWHTRLFHPGGMPSSHSAFVTSLLIIVGYKQSLGSTEFAIAFAFACIVCYDAFGVRYQLGEQARLLNKLQHLQHLKEQLGHTVVEVIGGIVFGTIITVIGIWFSNQIGL